MPRTRSRHRGHSSVWAVLGFLTLFAALVVFVCFYYLFPALTAAMTATRPQRQQMAAEAWLLLAVMLVILVSGLILTFRIGRLFFPGPTPKRTQTRYVDAWAEAGRRAELAPPPDDKTIEGPDGDGDDDDPSESWRNGPPQD